MWIRSGALLCTLLVAPVARADIVPPPDHECTLKKVAGPKDQCSACQAHSGAPQICRDRLAPRGMQHRCSSGGRSSWTEIWCAESTPEPVDPIVATASTAAPPPSASAAAGPGPVLASPTEPSATAASSSAPQSGAPPQPPEADPQLPATQGARGCGSCELGSVPTRGILWGLAAMLAALGLPLIRHRGGRARRRR